jgi:hypothetical protein
MGVAAAGSEVRAIHTAQALPLVLNGSVVGKYLVTSGNPNISAEFRLIANGRVSPLGKVGLTAVIQTQPFVGPNSSATGSATFFNRRGSVHLTYVGPVGPSPAPLPSMLFYTIVSGTGAYQGTTGSGTIGVSTKVITNLEPSANLVGEMTFVFQGNPTG